MGFSTLSFIFLFLPLAVGLYYLAPSRWRGGVLLFFSLAFYLLYQPEWLPVLCLSVLADYGLAQLLLRAKKPVARRLPVAVSVVKSVLLLGGCAVAAARFDLSAPVGLAVCSFTAAGYLVDCFRGEVQQPAGPVEFGLFCLLFCKLPTGPLVTWQELGPQLRQPVPSLSGMADGLVLLLCGLAKKLLLADWVYRVHLEIATIPYYEVTTLSAWLYTLTLALAVVFQLIAFSDIAQGVGLLFSLWLPGNMAYPAQAATVTEFFTRFNRTVTRFIDRYVFQPLGGGDNGPAATVVNLLLYGLLCGLWFGFSSGFLLWGAFLAAFCVAERLLWGKLLTKIPRFFARLVTWVVLLASFALFGSAQAPGPLFYLAKMFSLTKDLAYNDTILYLLSRQYPPILLCLVMLSGLPHRACRLLGRRFPRSMAAASVFANLALLLLVVILIL